MTQKIQFLVTPAELEAYVLIYSGYAQLTENEHIPGRIRSAADQIIALAERIKREREHDD